MKKFVLAIMIFAVMFGICSVACAASVADVIKQAQGMSNEELYRKAIEESSGKKFVAIGNSSRGKTALASFVKMLQQIEPSYKLEEDWGQPKNNTIFEALNADVNSANPVYAMTLIQDGNQIKSKMLDTGVLLNFVPKEWLEAPGLARENNEFPLALQTLNKVFMFNNVGGAKFDNMWDFVAEDQKPLFMGVNSELVGKNALYMMTSDKYATWIKEAYEKLSPERQAEYAELIEDMQNDADELGIKGENAKYGLTWVYLWCEKYNQETDDGPICTTLVTKSAAGRSGLIVYSKLRSVEETGESSVNNITVAAYQDNYEGIGGYAYKHYLMLTKTSPLPWTACAFIAYMTTTHDGFAAWGKDMGGYAPVPACMQDHSHDGYVDGENKFPVKNDRGYDWWLNKGRLVVEDPTYCASVSGVMSEWIDGIIAHK